MVWLGIFAFGIVATLSALQVISTGQILFISFIAVALLTMVAPVIAGKMAQKE
ncbi:hypothetical protein GCM10022378_11250 [Salinicoccus jeotgali]|uniref:DUF2929 domain-containing protein n=1 Tax=Salinicoccus jeotgali TaxID=381634 RepID=A0ABP7EQN7_9STAP